MRAVRAALAGIGVVAAALLGAAAAGAQDGHGSVTAWGYNTDAQCEVPEPNAGFAGVAAGYYHSLGVKESGSIVGWGNNDNGQCSVPARTRTL